MSSIPQHLQEHNYCLHGEESKSEVQNEISGRRTVIPTGLTRVLFKLPEGLNKMSKREQESLVKIPVKMDNSVLIGAAHQADLPEVKEPEKDRVSIPDRDEQIWTPRGEEKREWVDEYLEVMDNVFEGRIPKDIALQNLMENDYSIPESLETIDQKLKIVTQRFKPLATVQFMKFGKKFNRNQTGLRDLQDSCMKNYHIAEIQGFYHSYKNYRLQRNNRPIDCMCALPKNQDCVPRWSCSNCTKKWRPSMSSEDTESLCLICKTYSKITGLTRPANNTVFDDEEMNKIQDWSRIEKELGRTISKKEFEEIENMETLARLTNMDLTPEENMIINPTTIPHIRKKNLTQKQKLSIGRKLIEQLKPHPIPIAKKCACKPMKVENLENQEPKKKSTKRAAVGQFELDVEQLPEKRQRKKTANYV